MVGANIRCSIHTHVFQCGSPSLVDTDEVDLVAVEAAGCSPRFLVNSLLLEKSVSNAQTVYAAEGSKAFAIITRLVR
jgi:hypothetical protein